MIRKAEETSDIWGKEGVGCLLALSHFSLSFSHMTKDISLIPKANCPLVWEPAAFPLFYHGTAMRTQSLIRSGAIKKLALIVFRETSGSLLVVPSLLSFSGVINTPVVRIPLGSKGWIIPLGNLTKLLIGSWGHGSIRAPHWHRLASPWLCHNGSI